MNDILETETGHIPGAQHEPKPSLTGETTRGLSSHLPLSLYAAWRASDASFEGLGRSGDCGAIFHAANLMLTHVRHPRQKH
jgi:hypothetical protein